MCHAKQYEVREYGDGEITKITRVAPAFFYINLETLISEYFFSNAVFCHNYATEDCMEQEFFARGVQKSQVEGVYHDIPEVCRLQEAIGGRIVGPNPNVFCLEIGHDGFNPFTSC